MIVRRGNAGSTAIALGAVAVAALSLAPIGYLFSSGVSIGDIRREIRYPATTAAIGQTIALLVLVSTLTVVLGTGCALLVARTSVAFPRLLTVLFTLPLAVPGFVSSYAVFSAELVYFPHTRFVTSFPGATLVLSLALYPYVFLPCVVALAGVDPALVEVVSNLRRRWASTLRHVIIPALRPAIGAGVLIVAMHVLAEYGAMIQLGRSTLTTKIMAEVIDFGDYRSARSLSVLLAVLSVVVLTVTGLLSPRGRAAQVARGTARPPTKIALGWARWPLTVATLIVPLAAVGPAALMTVRGLTNPHRSAVIDWSRVTDALTATMKYALAAALFATIVALPVSWWVSRRMSPAAVATERAVWVAHAIPNAILALSLVYLATRLVPSMYKTASVLIAAYVILYLPLAVGYQRVGLDTSRRVYDDVAASLGSSPLATFARVTLPLALPGFIVGAILVGLDSSKELTTTLMLVPFNANTLSTRLWATTNGEALDFTAASPYAAMLVVLGVIPVFVLVRQALRYLGGHAR